VQIFAHVGDNTTLSCNTKLDRDVNWLRNDQVYLYQAGLLLNPRFIVDGNASRQSNLIIPNVQLNDSGNYTCVEDSGLERRHVYNVNITGTTTTTTTTTTTATTTLP